MNNKEWILKYFDRDLSEEELEEFNNKIEADAEFAREFSLYRQAKSTVDKTFGFPLKPEYKEKWQKNNKAATATESVTYY